LSARPGVWQSVRALPPWLRALLVGQFVNAAGALAWVYLALYLVQSRDLSAAHAGVLTGINGAGIIVGNLVAGWIGDRVGARRTLVTGLIGWAVCCGAVPITPVNGLGPLLLVAGTLSGFARPLMIAVVLGALPTGERRTAAALWRVAFNAGAIVGPPLGALAASWTFASIFAADAVTSVVLAVVVICFAPADRARTPHPDGRRPDSLWRTLRSRPLALAVLLTVVVVDTSYRQLYVGLPLELHRLDAPTVVYGLTVTANCVIIVAAEVWMALRMAGHAPGRVIALGYGFVGASWLIFGAHPAVATAFVLVAVISVGEMLYKPTATAAVADASPAGYEARYQSLYAGASVAGTVIAPPIGGALFAHHATLLWVASGLAPIAAAVVLMAPGLRGRPVGTDVSGLSRSHEIPALPSPGSVPDT
jgi:MFS family permease